MFTGIIEEVGKVLSINSNTISVEAETALQGTKLGDSIAVNGVCLTVTKLKNESFEADISQETLNISTLGSLKIGSFVNLERAMPINGRFGGHVVSGHVDGKGKIKKITQLGKFYNLECELTSDCLKYTVKKGSIAINGISLTIAEIENDIVKFAIIPHTFENTNLKTLNTGDYVNIETDMLARYVEKFLSTSDNKSGIDMEFLLKNGF